MRPESALMDMGERSKMQAKPRERRFFIGLAIEGL
jgi:hypothetical protein